MSPRVQDILTGASNASMHRRGRAIASLALIGISPLPRRSFLKQQAF